MEKPMCLRVEDAKKEIAEVINRYKIEEKIPCYILEPIMLNLYKQIVEGKNAEVAICRRNFEKNNAESEVGGNGP